jgi:hypothetical protein
MAEYDPSRTYALAKLQWALVDPSGAPKSLHQEIELALAAWAKRRGGIILDEATRQAFFRAMTLAKWKICPAHAWCRVVPAPIVKLPRAKRSVLPKAQRRKLPIKKKL